MKRATIEILLLLGILLISIWIVIFVGKDVLEAYLPTIQITKEGFQTVPTGSTTASAPPANTQKMLLVALGPTVAGQDDQSKIYISDTGTFTSPTWRMINGQLKNISGMEGRLYGASTYNTTYTIKKDTNYSEGNFIHMAGGLKQVSRDKFAVCGVTAANEIWCADSNIEIQANWTKKGGEAKWISMSNEKLAVIGMTNNVVYSPTYVTTSWTGINGNLGTRQMKQVVLDDMRVAAIDVEGLIYMADLTETGFTATGAPNAPRWFEVKRPNEGVNQRPVRFIEMRMGRVMVITDTNGLYYSDDYRSGTWTSVAMPNMEEVYNYGSYSYTKATGATQCIALGGRQATMEELNTAYASGANWCSCSWVSDSTRRYPIQDLALNWCGGTDPGIRDCGDALGATTCYGVKPAKGTVGVHPFNTKSWNAPLQAIEFVPFSRVPATCGTEGITDTYDGQKFIYYTREECNTLGQRQKAIDGRISEYNFATGECRIPGEFIAYNSTDADTATTVAIDVNKGDAAKKKVCESVEGRVFTKGDEAIAPGCGTAWCCQPAPAPAKPAILFSRTVCAATQDRKVPYTYSCYSWTAADQTAMAAIDTNKGAAAQRKVCEAVLGRIFTKGDNTLAPGCETCWCCQPSTSTAVSTPVSTSMSTIVWDDGATSKKCLFNKIKYAEKYGITGDIGAVYNHWITTGITSGYSPCGDISPGCRWDPDMYEKINPSVKQSKMDPLSHYKRVGARNGFTFCYSPGFIPILDELANQINTKMIVPPSAEIVAKCTANTYTNPAAIPEVFWYSPTNTYSVTKANAVATCATQNNATVATYAQLQDAQVNGADWCSAGWVSDRAYSSYPITTSISTNCGGGGAGIKDHSLTASVGVNCYGVKPSEGTIGVNPFNATKYSRYGAGNMVIPKQWICSSRTWSEKLFQGPAASDESYLNDTDSVCYTIDTKTKMYYCKTFKEDREGQDYSTSLMDDYQISCDNLQQGLTDLSGSIATLQMLKLGMSEGRVNINSARNSLLSIYTSMKCNTVLATSPLATTCTAIQNGMNTITTSYGNVDTSFSSISGPIDRATESKQRVNTLLTKLECR